ncbi:hypothetical protein N8782_00435 [Methylophilaceae bacterium]|nr:hypothetical protein [Methylophilaceae bacterium]MDA7843273.1 hypothetical protein [Methylophilaceae bacterium]
MKKLLLILLLAPTLIQAEEFNLVCEGEENIISKQFGFREEKKTIAVKVRKDFIAVDSIRYEAPYDNDGRRKDKYYIWWAKGEDSITVSFADKKISGCRETESSTEIDRITGLIETVTLYWDTCKGKVLERRAFEGQCKKQDRAF